MKKSLIFLSFSLVTVVGIVVCFSVAHKASQELQAGDICFSNTGQIATAVGKVVGPGRVMVARKDFVDKSWICVLVDGAERHATLGGGALPEDVPLLNEQGFRSPSASGARMMSIHRSLAKRISSHRDEDRIAVLICPKAEWSGLRLKWNELLR